MDTFQALATAATGNSSQTKLVRLLELVETDAAAPALVMKA